MRVLVTGGAGFLGSHVVERLLQYGHEVTIIDNFSTGSQANLRPGTRVIRGNVCSSDLASHLLQERPEVVIHLAAQVSVPQSMSSPEQDLIINVQGTVNVVEAAARAGSRKVIYVSSAAVYGTPDELPLTETSLTLPCSPYGLSKLVGEQYVRMLCRLRDLSFTILRPSNLYGPRQASNGEGAVIASFLQRFLTGQDAVIHGNGLQTRDFLYVTDMVTAVLLAMDRASGLTLNISSGLAVSINEVWQTLADLVQWGRSPIYGPVRGGDIAHSVMSNQLPASELDWKPTVPLTRGLADTVAAQRSVQAASSRM